MAARLTWKGRHLWLAEERTTGSVFKRNGWRWSLDKRTGPRAMSEPYEAEADARQDLESEVRRLLKEAGCEVEP